MPGCVDQISDDLAVEQRDYLETRRRLEALLPRARGLCFKHGLRDPFVGLVRVSLGQHAPQHRDTSALGRSERMAVTDCLMQLTAACQEWAAPPDSTDAPLPTQPDARPRGNWLRRLIDYLY
jgi:hypothetical protein